MDTDCNIFSLDYDARPGETGANAVSYLTGGYGYRGSAGGACGPAGPGNAGTTSHGPGGGAPMAGGAVAGGLWVPNGGGGGGLGVAGTGGGGGGGSGGCDSGTDSHGAGGGGGGAGGVAAPSAGGGGGGGGGSFCVFGVSSALTVTNCELVRGSGGNGGAGGAGGRGQPGGSGGPGGNGAGGSLAGGSGGAGGVGGTSGGGSGGAGGVSYAIFGCGGSLTLAGNIVSGGAAGIGGSAGTAAPGGSPGAGGPMGVLAVTGACPEPAPAAGPMVSAARTLPAAVRVGPACDATPCVTVDVPPGGRGLPLDFAGARPNPARDGATFLLSLPQAASVRLRVFDASGRLVREIDPGTLEAGRHVVAWDGRDASGARVGAGVYFARFDALGRGFMRRFTLVR
jgi:hypothetical protein